MQNHEKSKKHKEMVVFLRQQLEAEDESLTPNSGEKAENEEDEDEEGVEEMEDTPRQK